MSAYPPQAYHSNLTPQDYNEDALKYVSENATSINETANRLGVSPEAVAGSMAREITRADGAAPYSAIGHSLAVWKVLNFTSQQDFARDYEGDLKQINKDKGVFDGDIGFIKRVLHPTLSDIGPGAIKVLTAFQIIKQYQDTPQGKALGLDEYKLTDLKTIVNNLNDRSNSLSIKIAGLVVLNGQKFFGEKSIEGIPWPKLSKEQQDAALTAYYTIGEHAVSVDMAQNEFRPFTPGPGGGQVGPWILFGHNYSNLNAILAKGRSLGPSVAPVPRPKPPQKASSKYMKHAEAGDILAPVGRILDALPADRHSVVHTTANATNAPATKYIAKTGGLPHALAQDANYAFQSAVTQRGSKHVALARRRPSGLNSEFLREQKNVMPALYMSLTSQRAVLPSIAPVAGRPGVMSAQHLTGHHSTAISSGDRQDSIAGQSMAKKIGKQNLRLALHDLLNAQSRLPPSGPTAFDPRLTPAWAGLKLPQ